LLNEGFSASYDSFVAAESFDSPHQSTTADGKILQYANPKTVICHLETTKDTLKNNIIIK
jgi:hypothetical protein